MGDFKNATTGYDAEANVDDQGNLMVTAGVDSSRTQAQLDVLGLGATDTYLARPTDGANQGNLIQWNGTSWDVVEVGGAASVYGLARNAVRVSAAAYNTTEILGFRILATGSGTLTLSPVGGATDIVVTAAELTAMGINAFQDWPMHLDSITAGTGMELMVYTP